MASKLPTSQLLGVYFPKVHGPHLVEQPLLHGKREGGLANESSSGQILAAVGIGQGTSHPPFHVTFQSLGPQSANLLLGKRDRYRLIGVSQSQSRATPSA